MIEVPPREPAAAARGPTEKRPDGTGSIYFRGRVAWIAYIHNGEQVCESTRQGTVKVAEKLLREKLRTADTPAHITAQAERVSFDEVAALIHADYKRKGNRTYRDMVRRVRQLREVFNGPWLAITTVRVERYKNECLARGLKKGTINLRLADLRRMGRLAMRTTPPLVPSCPYISLFDVSDNA